MISKGHKKHAVIKKPSGGNFHRNEIAILGAPCSIILDLSIRIAERMQNRFRVGFVDADHHDDKQRGIFSKHYTDKISHHGLKWDQKEIKLNFRSLFNDEDLVLVNGNHFGATQQIVLITEEKKESLSRKLDRLTDVMMIILGKDQEQVHSFIKERLDGKNIPVFKMKDTTDIISFLEARLEDNRPLLKGLVFAGGKSSRMGFDKGAIDFHGRPQREYLADLLQEFTSETFFSVQKPDQFDGSYPMITDTFRELGPYGGLLSAFRDDPDCAWLAVACDIPLLDNETIKQLVINRDLSRVATCFHNPVTDFPEPLITIWEPRAYQILLQFLANGFSCPRKVLINSDINELQITHPEMLKNVNTPEQLEEVRANIRTSMA